MEELNDSHVQLDVISAAANTAREVNTERHLHQRAHVVLRMRTSEPRVRRRSRDPIRSTHAARALFRRRSRLAAEDVCESWWKSTPDIVPQCIFSSRLTYIFHSNAQPSQSVRNIPCEIWWAPIRTTACAQCAVIMSVGLRELSRR